MFDSISHKSSLCLALSQLGTALIHTSAFGVSLPHYFHNLFTSFLCLCLAENNLVTVPPAPTVLFSSSFTVTSSKFHFWELPGHFMLYFLFIVAGEWEKSHHCSFFLKRTSEKPIALNNNTQHSCLSLVMNPKTFSPNILSLSYHSLCGWLDSHSPHLFLSLFEPCRHFLGLLL